MISAVMPNANRLDLAFERGEGVYLYTQTGERYLDFTSGIAVLALGHSHPYILKALQTQAARLWHVSNLYKHPEMEKLAKRLTMHSFAEMAFFCNSGAEANECGLKIIRKYHHDRGHPERYRIITFGGAFHGRSLATVAATGNSKYLEGFAPALDGFDQVPFGNIEAVQNVIGHTTAGIFIEPIQGEGGICQASPDYLCALRDIANANNLLLMFDEVQCGYGRTGKLFAHEWTSIVPDIMSVAKGMGNGFPVAACLTTTAVGSCMGPGSHGTTYGGNPLAMAVANAVLDLILENGFLERVQVVGKYLSDRLDLLAKTYPNLFIERRGCGLMLGIRCVPPNDKINDRLRKRGLLLVKGGDNVLRILPPLTVSKTDIDEALAIFEAVAQSW